MRFMRTLWKKSKLEQLDLVAPHEPDLVAAQASDAASAEGASASLPEIDLEAAAFAGVPLLLPVDALQEDPSNPRTEFAEAEIAELAEDIALRGILQPIVVHRAATDARYRVMFGAKRLRAAKRAGLETVPVVIAPVAHDGYAQVAENQKRHGLTALDLARFMRARVDAGESNAEIARRLGVDLTTVAHHLALLTLPPELDEALRSGRCTSPRTLYELARLHATKPEQVKAIVAGEGEITRRKVASLKKAPQVPRRTRRDAAAPRRKLSLADRASGLCDRLESLLAQMKKPGASITCEELGSLRQRLAVLAGEQER
jgi:ParB family chromosome partitioning protein